MHMTLSMGEHWWDVRVTCVHHTYNKIVLLLPIIVTKRQCLVQVLSCALAWMMSRQSPKKTPIALMLPPFCREDLLLKSVTVSPLLIVNLIVMNGMKPVHRIKNIQSPKTVRV